MIRLYLQIISAINNMHSFSQYKHNSNNQNEKKKSWDYIWSPQKSQLDTKRKKKKFLNA